MLANKYPDEAAAFNWPDDSTEYQENKMVMPGDNVMMVCDLNHPIALEDGQRFNVREGGRTVATGICAKIKNKLALGLRYRVKCHFIHLHDVVSPEFVSQAMPDIQGFVERIVIHIFSPEIGKSQIGIAHEQGFRGKWQVAL